VEELERLRVRGAPGAFDLNDPTNEDEAFDNETRALHFLQFLVTWRTNGTDYHDSVESLR